MPRLVGADGVVDVADADVDRYLGRGYRLERDGEGYDRAAEAAAAEIYGGVLGGLQAGALGAARGLSLGLSDVALAAAGRGENVRGIKEENPTISTVAELISGVAPALLTGGTSALARGAAYTPAGAVARAGLGAGQAIRAGGGAGRAVAGVAAGGAIEGAAQGAGSYISDVALGDKNLSAEGFLGAMGEGALWGGAAGGVFGLGEQAIARARKLFPGHEITREAAREGERTAERLIDEAVRDGEQMSSQAREAVRQRREALMAMDLEARQAINAAKVRAAEEQAAAAARVAGARATAAETKAQAAARAAEARAASVEAKAQSVIDRADAAAWKADAQAANVGKGGRKARAAMQPKGEISPVVDDAAAAVDDVAAKVDEVTPPPNPSQDVRAIEDAMDAAAAKYDPELAKLVNAERAHRSATEGVESWRMTRQQVRDYAAGLKTSAAKSAQQRALDTGELAFANQTLGASRKQGTSITSVKFPDADRPLVEAMTPEEFAAYRDNFGGQSLAGRRVEVSEGQLIDSDTGEVLIDGAGRGDVVYDTRGAAPAGAAERAGVTDPQALAEAQARDAVMARRGVVRGRSLEDLAAAVNRINGHPVAATSAAVDDALAKAISPAPATEAEDIVQMSEAVTAYESASADLADALGAVAPRGAAERAAGYRAAVADTSSVDAARAAQVAESLDRDPDAVAAMARSAFDNPPPRPSLHDTQRAADVISLDGMMPEVGSTRVPPVGKYADMAGILELVGDGFVNSIPIIGPLLSPLLKARAAMQLAGKFGAKVGASAESKIAAKAATTRDRIGRAIGRALEAGTTSARVASRAAPPAAAILSHKLFPASGEELKPPAPDYADETQRAYLDRLGELAAASQPGAIRQAVRRQLPGADPRIVSAIEQATERKLSFLASKVAKPPAPSGIFGGPQWAPPRSEVARFARYCRAVDDPAGVIERVADDDVVTKEDAETLRAVYPSLLSEAQRLLMEGATKRRQPIPYSRRVQLSTLFDAPLDGTTQPEYVAAVQAAFKRPPANDPTQPEQPPAPGIAAPINFSSFSPDAGRRAG